MLIISGVVLTVVKVAVEGRLVESSRAYNSSLMCGVGPEYSLSVIAGFL